jgi:hypothetical protein
MELMMIPCGSRQHLASKTQRMEKKVSALDIITVDESKRQLIRMGCLFGLKGFDEICSKTSNQVKSKEDAAQKMLDQFVRREERRYKCSNQLTV